MGTLKLSDSIGGALLSRAENNGSEIAFTFFKADGTVDQELTYLELKCAAVSIAAQLMDMVGSNGRVVVSAEPGPLFLAATLGCLLAGVSCVPLQPAGKLKNIERAKSVAGDFRPDLVIVDASAGPADSKFWGGIGVNQLCIEEIDRRCLLSWAASTTSTLVQYTSGSTGAPKGVVLNTHNILYNCCQIQRAFNLGSSSRGIVWLPPHHDMGLIGGLFTPLYTGFWVGLMKPRDFVRRPLGWLELMSRYRGTVSGCPNFGLELVLREAGKLESEALDLSNWSTCFVGAETIRAKTLIGFGRALERFGFKTSSFYPCYGLAEATLIVTGAKQSIDAQPILFDLATKTVSRLDEIKDADCGQVQVGCGTACSGTTVLVVDEASGLPVPDGEIGEICVISESLSPGYWSLSGLLNRTTPEFHTNDFGFLAEGQLFVIGRREGAFKVRGVNYWSEDIEDTIFQILASEYRGVGIAVVYTEQRLTGVVEGLSSLGLETITPLVAKVRAGIAQKYLLTLDSLVLVRPNSLPRTLSGKIQRKELVEMLKQGRLRLVREFGLASSFSESSKPKPPESSEELWLQDWLVSRNLVWPGSDQSLFSSGIDSLLLVELVEDLRNQFGYGASFDKLYRPSSIREFFAVLRSTEREFWSCPNSRAPIESGLYECTPAQERMLRVLQDQPHDIDRVLSACIKLTGNFEVSKAQQAFEALLLRHPTLTSTFKREDDKYWVCEGKDSHGAWRVVDFSSFADPVTAAREAVEKYFRSPMNLSSGPLVGILIALISEGECLLGFRAHHAVFDGWSAMIVTREFESLYNGKPLPPRSFTFEQYAKRQRENLTSGEGKSFSNKQRQRLEKYNAAYLRRYRPGTSFVGRKETGMISAERAARIAVQARRFGVTKHAIYMTLFASTLNAVFGNEDRLIGCPFLNRFSAETFNTVGYIADTQLVEVLASPLNVNALSASLAEAAQSSEMPLPHIMSLLQQGDAMGFTPIYDERFCFMDFEIPLPALTRVTSAWVPISAGSWGSTRRITQYISRRSEGYDIIWLWDAGRVSQAESKRAREHYEQLLSSF